MAMNWHIDAWSPTEGLAFASKRESDVDLWNVDAMRPLPTYAIAAPEFEAQPVDRSVAFGAVRRGFQERFSLDGDTEFAFASLGQIMTLVRRTYLGGGPGTTGGGEPEPGEPGPEGNDGPPRIPDQFLSVNLAVSLQDDTDSGSNPAPGAPSRRN